MSASPPRWRPLLTDDGSYTLIDERAQQACHSSAGAWTESVERYARAARLRERAHALQQEQALRQEQGLGEPVALRLLDIGTGLAWNLAAAALELAGCGVRLVATSLESERGVLEAALELPPSLPAAADQLRRACLRAGLESLAAGQAVPLSDPEACGAPTHLRLLLGDAVDSIRGLPPGACFDAVFLDPFSPGADPPLWSAVFLAEVGRRMAPGAWLSTYTVAMSVRERLALAGLRVGLGPRVGRKAQGTLACMGCDPPPFDERTERKFRRRLALRAQNGESIPRSDY